jgi:isopentenyl-diphosphate delta-isomerase
MLDQSSDTLILVNEADEGVGHLSKMLCHQGRGILHRAFSLLIFNDSGELLIQQRSASKRLWPLYALVQARMGANLARAPRPSARFAI